jgi:Skp family chaperone for outer membrane proteins
MAGAVSLSFRVTDWTNIEGVRTHPMKSTSVLAALLVGLIPVAAHAQAASEPAATPAAAPPAASAAAPAAAQAAPTAYPAKIALIAFEQAVITTNEGQRTLADMQKKYAPQKTKLEALAAEIDTLKKQLQSGSEEQRAAKLKEIDAKDKQLQNQSEDASNSYNAEVQEALSKVMAKVNVVVQDYVKKNGYTLLLDVGGQQSPVMWTAAEPNADITRAIIEAYNASSGVAAPPPAAPAPTAVRPRPSSSTAPKTTPKTPATK